MKRVWKLSDAAQSEFLLSLHRCAAHPKPTTPPYRFNVTNSPNFRFIRDANAQTHSCLSPSSSSSSSSSFPISVSSIIALFGHKHSPQDLQPREDLAHKVNQLKDELVLHIGDSQKIASVLEKKGCSFFWIPKYGYAFVELMNALSFSPNLALEVFNWRRNGVAGSTLMTSHEYSKGIVMAGKAKNVELAVELFTEAVNKQLKTTSLYNALMSAYMFNGLTAKCQSLFRDLKREQDCLPTIVTYNILISTYGRLTLVDHMEATVRGLEDANLSPNVSTYNNLIAGYITAWMWDSMEQTYQKMKEGPVSPDMDTHLLMLRGYSHSDNLVKMEETYQLVKHHVDDKEIPLIRGMICAYCRSSVTDRLKRISKLMELIPENEYRPWLNVLLIRAYAQEDSFEAMEKSINEAFERKTSVTTAGVMRSIISSYFRCNKVDKLEHFVKRAECASWRICRSLYHCRMVMYASQKRLEEMENVFSDMKNFNMDYTRKTFMILYKAYSLSGQRQKVARVIALMCKHGYEVPLDALPL